MDEHLQVGKTLRSSISCLPGPDASLGELIKFCRSNDPSQEFKERWDSEFVEHVRELWAASTHAFKAGRATGYDQDEVLMCMAYDVAVAPYLGVPEDISHSYLHAMLRELREKV